MMRDEYGQYRHRPVRKDRHSDQQRGDLMRTLVLTPFEELNGGRLAANARGEHNRYVSVLCRAVAPHMRARKYGRIVNFSSGTAFKGAPMMMHYVASKGAIISMTRALARELGGDSITANAIIAGLHPQRRKPDQPRVRRFGQPVYPGWPRNYSEHGYQDDLMGSVAFLASDDSAFVTGQILAVDGGSVYH